jgi:hypothetical protein
MNLKNNHEYRLTQVEKCQKELETKVDLILENHLPHLREELASIRTELRTSSIINVGAIILGLLISRLIQ